MNLPDLPQVTVREFLAELPADANVNLVGGDSGIDAKYISSVRVQKLGMALAGFSEYIRPGRVQIIGKSEIKFLSRFDDGERKAAVESGGLQNASCLLLTTGLDCPIEIKEIADDIGIPILRTDLPSSKAISAATDTLRSLLAPITTLHGVLLEIFGSGVLLIGESGIGKSECALDLINRGHRLVADDAVRIKRMGSELRGAAPKLLFEHIEIRGLGIINIRELHGAAAVCPEINVSLCIELKNLVDYADTDRLNLERELYEILELEIPKIVLPVSPGRNLSTLVETAVRIFLMSEQGTSVVENLLDRHSKEIEKSSNI